MDGLLLEIPIAENDKEILENLLTKPETSSPPLESLSETAAKVLFELAINKVRSRKKLSRNRLRAIHIYGRFSILMVEFSGNMHPRQVNYAAA